jgi:hypothetical protein
MQLFSFLTTCRESQAVNLIKTLEEDIDIECTKGEGAKVI